MFPFKYVAQDIYRPIQEAKKKRPIVKLLLDKGEQYFSYYLVAW